MPRIRTERKSIIANNRPLGDVMDQAREVLIASNSARMNDSAKHGHNDSIVPLLFRRGDQLMRMRCESRLSPWLDSINVNTMYGIISRDITWVSRSMKGKDRIVKPLREVATDMVSMPAIGFPEVSNVLTTPVFGASGNIMHEPGLHAADKIWMHRDPSLNIRPVPIAPSYEERQAALAIIERDLFVDFPFQSQSDRAHAIAALLLPFARRMIDGATPLHIVESPTIGSGKSKLCNLINIVCSGSSPQTMTLPGNDDEIRKTLITELCSGRPMILIDNVRERSLVNSPDLASALTSDTWGGRLLGRNEDVYSENRALWMMTGNNPRISSEIARRSVRIRITPDDERPWKRVNFKHPNIEAWAEENRAQLVHACLVIIQAWVAMGKPQSRKMLGSFDAWSRVMGGILAVAGVGGFLDSMDEVMEESYGSRDTWSDFIKHWWSTYGTREVYSLDLNNLCERFGLLEYIRGSGSMRSKETRLGRNMRDIQGVVFDRLKVCRSTRYANRMVYYLKEVEIKQQLPNIGNTS